MMNPPREALSSDVVRKKEGKGDQIGGKGKKHGKEDGEQERRESRFDDTRAIMPILGGGG